MESRSGVRKEKIHGEQESSKKGKDTWRAEVEKERKRYMESSYGVRKEKETWRAGVE